MYIENTKPLIACTTNAHDFRFRVEAAAAEINSDFWSSRNLGQTLQECVNHRLSCLVVDYENVPDFEDQFKVFKHDRNTRTLIVAVPKGDVRAAFGAAGAGAVNVIEKPMQASELVTNLKTALVSESRMEEFISGDKRFTDPLFDCLTVREKSILRLLMDGEPNKRVASILDVGLRTVEGDRAQVMKKLRADSFVELITFVSRIENNFAEARKNIFGSVLPKLCSHDAA